MILISEVKSQGTNDAREKEGKSKQAMGNAIERLGKNMIGFRTPLSPNPPSVTDPRPCHRSC